MMGMRGFFCATQAGGCAAMATVCGKLALTPAVASTLVEGFCLYVSGLLGSTLPVLATNQLTFATRFLAVAGIIFFNALMWVLFTKSMHLCSSTLEATACTTSSNFIFTAVLGKLVFREQLGIMWCLGSVLMVLGLVVLHRSCSPETESGINISQNDQLWTKKKT